MTKRLTLCVLVFTIILSSCAGYKVPPNISAEDRFELGKRMMQNKDYLDAKTQFKVLTLNYPGIKFMDEAQFYLAECHFYQKEYILAADEYSRLVRLYPNSQWVDDSQYKIGVCDFRLSPKPSLDQKYTLDAIRHLQTFIEDFPNSDLVPEAERLLNICRGKIAEKEYKTGELYRKLKDRGAALVYYNSVLASYYDSKFAEGALYWKGQCLFTLDRKDESLETFEEFLQKYPKSKMRSEALARAEELRKLVDQEANGTAK